MENLHYLDIAELSQRIARREISPVALTESMLERVGRLDPQLHAYARVLPDLALKQARAAEAALANAPPKSALHGVPIGVKDLCWLADYPTAAGTTVYKDFVPSVDATVVRKLQAAGAVILGKLQLTEGAFAIHHETIPTPLNPWGAAHWSGASSSGSGVATAAGLCYAAIGTDTGGSIRFPCAANGLTGIKPTWGRVSRFGVFELAASLDHVGPMVRSARDAALMLSLISGDDPLDPTASPQGPLDLPITSQDLKSLRIGIDPAWNARSTDPVILEAIDAALQVFKELGARIVEVHYPDARAVVDEWETNCGVEVAVAHASVYPKHADQYGPALARLIDIGRTTSAMRYQEVLLNRMQFRGKLNRLLEDVDLLLMPVQPYAAPTYEQLGALADDPEANSRLIQYTAPINSSGHPAITLPCGSTPAGLPIAFQLVACHWGEALLCRAGIAYQDVTAWHKAHPQLD